MTVLIIIILIVVLLMIPNGKPEKTKKQSESETNTSYNRFSNDETQRVNNKRIHLENKANELKKRR